METNETPRTDHWVSNTVYWWLYVWPRQCSYNCSNPRFYVVLETFRMLHDHLEHKQDSVVIIVLIISGSQDNILKAYMTL